MNCAMWLCNRAVQDDCAIKSAIEPKNKSRIKRCTAKNCSNKSEKGWEKKKGNEKFEQNINSKHIQYTL